MKENEDQPILPVDGIYASGDPTRYENSKIFLRKDRLLISKALIIAAVEGKSFSVSEKYEAIELSSCIEAEFYSTPPGRRAELDEDGLEILMTAAFEKFTWHVRTIEGPDGEELRIVPRSIADSRKKPKLLDNPPLFTVVKTQLAQCFNVSPETVERWGNERAELDQMFRDFWIFFPRRKRGRPNS